MSDFHPFPGEDLNAAGLNRQHVFDLAALPAEITNRLDAAAGERQLILIGHAGRRLWEQVLAAGIGGEHPIDHFTIATIQRWFAAHFPDHRYRILYPGDAPVGLQALGKLAGWHQPSPFMVGIDPEWGSWFAYRAVILADSRFSPSFPVDRSNPCLNCLSQPCIAACPAGALAGGQFALNACTDFRLQPASPCQHTCLARLACPVGTAHRYSEAQLHHTYAQSLAMIRHWASPETAPRNPNQAG